MAIENDIALIESYLLGESNADQRNELEERLETDSEFRSLFEDTQVMLEGLGKLRHKSLLAKMDELEVGLGNPLEVPKQTKTIFWTVQRIAAAFIGLAIITVAAWYYVNDGPASGTELYSEYFAAYDNVMVPVTRSNEDSTLLIQSFRAYEEQRYDDAAPLFDKLLEEGQPEFVRFYAAIVYMETGQIEKAIPFFRNSVEEQGEFRQQATWYLSLAYIKKDDFGRAEPLLNMLLENNTYGEKARQLLKKMR